MSKDCTELTAANLNAGVYVMADSDSYIPR